MSSALDPKTFRRAVDSSGEVVFLTDREGVFTYVNPAFTRLYGWPAAEVVGKVTPRILKSGTLAPEEYAAFWRTLLAREVVKGEVANRARDGRLVEVAGSASAVVDDGGEITGFMAIQTDVTERNGAYQALRESEIASRALIASMREAEARNDQLNRLLRTISAVNDLIVRERDRARLLAGTCRIAVELGGFRAAWVGLARDGDVLFEAAEGIDLARLRSLGARTEGPCERLILTGRAIRRGARVIVEDVETVSAPSGVRELLQEFGIASAAAFPVRVDGTVTGALSVACAQKGFLGEEVVALLEEMAGDLGFALEGFANVERLARSEALHRGFFESPGAMRGVVETVDEDLRIVSSNAELAAWYGREASELPGCCISELGVPPPLIAHWRELAVEARRTGAPVRTDFEWPGPSGRRFLSGSTSHLGASPEGGELFAFTALDVTERRTLEEEYRQAQKLEAVGRLAGGVAHDFNNLLTVISGHSELLLQRLDPGAQAREHAREVAAAAERAAALTRRLLAFSRKQVLEPRVVDLNAIVSGIRSLLARLLGDDIEVALRLREGACAVTADPGQLEQVVMNLAVNARDAMPQGGRLTLETRREEREGAGWCVLAVSDTGIGMDAETASHAFEPFFTTKEPGKGTGLGLATVFGVVKQSGGEISFTSAPGRGTTFDIRLPCAEALPASPRASGTHRPVSAPSARTVMVVEDDAAVRLLTATLLRSAGYEVLAPASAEEALALATSHPARVDALVSDVEMPGMSGPRLAARIVAARPGLAVLFVSGYSDEAIARHGELCPGAAFLQKPFTAADLTRKLRDLLEG